MMNRNGVILGMLSLFLTMAFPIQAQDTTLSIIWRASDACTALDTLTDEYPSATISVNCVPETQWFDAIFIDFAAGIGADLVIMDTQFLGTATSRNYLTDLTTWAQSTLPLTDYDPALLTIHTTADGQLVALPLLPDVRMLAYRADIYQQAGLLPPTTWTGLLNQAQSLQTSDRIDYGYATSWSRQSDYVVSSWNHILWSFEGALWDQASYTADGVVNSDQAQQALTLANSLWQTAPPNAITYTPDDVIAAICTGTTAIVEIWATDANQITNPNTCDQSDNITFARVPAETAHFTSYGGDAIAIRASSQKQAESLAFLAWIQSDFVQERWILVGGFSGRTSINQATQDLAPYLPIFAESLPLVRDYWQLPEFQILRNIQQQYINLATSNQLDPIEALDTIAIEHQRIFDANYPITTQP
ncbi:MAG: extracellular solute-binding protein [Phototrophicaceae bacterium]